MSTRSLRSTSDVERNQRQPQSRKNRRKREGKKSGEEKRPRRTETRQPRCARKNDARDQDNKRLTNRAPLVVLISHVVRNAGRRPAFGESPFDARFSRSPFLLFALGGEDGVT